MFSSFAAICVPVFRNLRLFVTHRRFFFKEDGSFHFCFTNVCSPFLNGISKNTLKKAVTFQKNTNL